MKNITYIKTDFECWSVLRMYINDVYIGVAEWFYDDAHTIINKFDWLIEDTRIESHHDCTYIQSFYICDEFRGLGYSHKLIRKTLSEIRKRKYSQHICLIVENSYRHFGNLALYKLYDKHKFRQYANSKCMFIYRKTCKKTKNC